MLLSKSLKIVFHFIAEVALSNIHRLQVCFRFVDSTAWGTFISTAQNSRKKQTSCLQERARQDEYARVFGISTKAR